MRGVRPSEARRGRDVGRTFVEEHSALFRIFVCSVTVVLKCGRAVNRIALPG